MIATARVRLDYMVIYLQKHVQNYKEKMWFKAYAKFHIKRYQIWIARLPWKFSPLQSREWQEKFNNRYAKRRRKWRLPILCPCVQLTALLWAGLHNDFQDTQIQHSELSVPVFSWWVFFFFCVCWPEISFLQLSLSGIICVLARTGHTYTHSLKHMHPLSPNSHTHCNHTAPKSKEKWQHCVWQIQINSQGLCDNPEEKIYCM